MPILTLMAVLFIPWMKPQLDMSVYTLFRDSHAIPIPSPEGCSSRLLFHGFKGFFKHVEAPHLFMAQTKQVFFGHLELLLRGRILNGLALVDQGPGLLQILLGPTLSPWGMAWEWHEKKASF